MKLKKLSNQYSNQIVEFHTVHLFFYTNHNIDGVHQDLLCSHICFAIKYSRNIMKKCLHIFAAEFEEECQILTKETDLQELDGEPDWAGTEIACCFFIWECIGKGSVVGYQVWGVSYLVRINLTKPVKQKQTKKQK